MKTAKKVAALLVCATIIGTLSCGCASKTNCAANGEKKTLTVANWKNYGSDTDFAVKTFEKENNCKIVHQYINAEDDYITMMKQGGLGKIDVMLPNLAYMQRVISANLAEPLDKSKLKNFNDLIPTMRDTKDLCDKSGKLYGIPWVWGTTAMVYNTEKVTEKPTSYADMWDKKYQGKMAFDDEASTAVLTAALYLKSKDPYNPDLDAVKKALIEAKKNSKIIWKSSDDFTKAFTSGSTVIGNLWSGTATRLSAEKQKLTYVYPKEGTIEWQDNWVIAKNSPNKDLAYKWLDFMTSQEFLTKFTSDPKNEPPVPANQKALNSMTDDQKKLLWVYPEVPKNLLMQKALSDETSKKWLDLWNEVKAS